MFLYLFTLSHFSKLVVLPGTFLLLTTDHLKHVWKRFCQQGNTEWIIQFTENDTFVIIYSIKGDYNVSDINQLPTVFVTWPAIGSLIARWCQWLWSYHPLANLLSNGDSYQVMYTKPHIPAVTWWLQRLNPCNYNFENNLEFCKTVDKKRRTHIADLTSKV